MKARIGKTDVVIERGDLTDWEVDAIVNAANSHLWMGTGVAGAIKRKGGVIIEEEAVRQGPIEAEGVGVTNARNRPPAPPLGAGVGCFPPAGAPEARLGAVVAHLKAGATSLRKIAFVLYQEEAW